jgi:hypothetical protein
MGPGLALSADSVAAKILFARVRRALPKAATEPFNRLRRLIKRRFAIFMMVFLPWGVTYGRIHERRRGRRHCVLGVDVLAGGGEGGNTGMNAPR